MKIFVIGNLGGHSDNVANAMLADDHEGITNAHGALKAAKDQMAEFANHWQGEILGDSGEDSCWAFEVQDPEIFLCDLEGLKAHIQEISGHNLTLGVGEGLADAGKAFLYGKMNESDDISVYDPSMEQEMAEMGGEAEAAPEQEPFYGEEENEEPIEEEIIEEPVGDISDEGNSDVPNLPSEENEVGIPDHEEDQGEVQPEDSEEAEFADEEQPDQESDEPVEEVDYENEDGQPEEYKPFTDGAVANTTNVAVNGDEGDLEYQDIGKSPYYPSAEINAGAPKEGEMDLDEEPDADDEDMEEDSESYNDEAEKDGEPENEEEPLEESQDEEIIDIPDSKESKEMQRQQDEDQEANENTGALHEADGDQEDEHEENPDYTMDEDEDEYADNELVNPEEEQEGDEVVQEAGREDDGNMMGDAAEEMPEGGAMQPEGEMPTEAQQGLPMEEMPQGEVPPDEAAQEIPQEEMPEDQEYDMADDMVNEEQVAEELREQIATALQGFQAQKEAMMAMQDQAPELYAATLVLLQTLIQMSQLIFGDEEGGEEGQEQPYYEQAPEEEMPAEEPVEEEALVNPQ